MTGSVRVGVDISSPPAQAFERFADEVGLALADRGMNLDKASVGGRITVGDLQVGTIKDWVPGKKISILWHPKDWEKAATCEVSVTFEGSASGTNVVVEQRGWGLILGDDGAELLGWFSGEVVASLLSSSSPGSLGDWLTDRGARRPSGARSRGFYRDPIYHRPNFAVILQALALKPSDRLLEVGCGGGAFLHDALRSGCTASAVDHSPDMVRLASELNRDSISEGRLKLSVGDAGELPYADGAFTCAAMTGVLGFLPDALLTFKEVHRVLEKGGRFVVFGASKALRGTPAAPEPMASRLHFYEDGEVERLARQAGFAARVEHPSLLKEAVRAGVPETDLGLFRGTEGSQLLIATKR